MNYKLNNAVRVLLLTFYLLFKDFKNILIYSPFMIKLLEKVKEKIFPLYTGPDKSQNYTLCKFGRYPEIDSFIREYFSQLPTIPNILCVGIGMNKEGNSSGTLPIELSSILESKEKDYKIAIIDTESRVLKMLKNKKEVSFGLDYYFSPESGSLEVLREEDWNSWVRYLQDTHQEIPDLTCLIEEAHNKSIEEIALSSKLPSRYVDKIGNGDVSFVCGDVITYDLSSLGPFDFIHCLNILCHIPSEQGWTKGEILDRALNNMIKPLRKGGILLVDDYSDEWDGTFVQTAWKIEGLEEKGIVSIDKKINDGHYSYLFVKKN
jgi:hypothetical protein